MNKPTPCDVLIVGGGLVGASLAACLARDPALNIVVLEKAVLPVSKPGGEQNTTLHPSYDARNTALANGTCHVFEQLGLWQTLREQATPILQVKVSDKGGFGRTQITAEAERVRALGYIVENRWVGTVLLEHLAGCPNVTWLAPGEVTQVQFKSTHVQVSAKVGEKALQFQSPLLVAADGAQSSTRSLLGIGSTVTPYHQTGIVTTLTPDRPHHHCAWERFTESGPLALLPQTDNRLGVTWCVETEAAEALLAADDATFLKAIQGAAGNDAGTFIKVGKRYSYPLALTLSDEQVRPNLVVLGNSAHGMHPVAGQGLNMSMRDVAALTQTLFAARELGENYGDLKWLQHYMALRGWDQNNTVHFSDKVTRLFSNANAVMSFARNSGLLMFDVLPGAKRFLARYAMGRAASTTLPEPPLSQGQGAPSINTGVHSQKAVQ